MRWITGTLIRERSERQKILGGDFCLSQSISQLISVKNRKSSENRYRYRNRYRTETSLKITRIDSPVDSEQNRKNRNNRFFYRNRYRNRPSLILHLPISLSIPRSISVKNRKSSENRYRYRNRYRTVTSLKSVRIDSQVDLGRFPTKTEKSVTGYFFIGTDTGPKHH